MKNPTEQEIIDEYRRTFPGYPPLSDHERTFLAFIHIVRSHGVGYGWMRQAVGLAWRVADPVGYIDDDVVIALHTAKPVDPLWIENRALDEQERWLEKLASGSRETSEENHLFVQATRALKHLRDYRAGLKETIAAARPLATGGAG